MMKKNLLLLSMALMSMTASAQIFGKGDIVADIGIGVGSADNFKISGGIFPALEFKKSSGATFTQKLAFEFGVAEFGKSSIGVGMQIDNAFGAKYDNIVSGNYNYDYTLYSYHRVKNAGGRYVWELSDAKSVDRQGVGIAKASCVIDNVDVMVKASFHHQFVDRLDTYATLGLGISAYKVKITPDAAVAQGFSSAEKMLDRNSTEYFQLAYKYDDLDHVEWAGSEAIARFSMALYVGARYYLTDNWAVNAELGLVSASFKKDANAYNIFSIGASYKF